jgi:hypothetical protein
MRIHYDPTNPWLALGMASLVLAFVGMFLFPLPILGTPISLLALAFGLAGFVLGLASPRSSLRWSLGGIAASLVAVGINLLIYYAPYLGQPDYRQPTQWQEIPGRAIIPPPATP